MLSCRELAHRHASDYLDGQLNWRVGLGVRWHLLICAHCRRFVAQLRKVRTLLRSAPLTGFAAGVATVGNAAAGSDAAAQELGMRLADFYLTQKNSSPPL